MNAMNPRPYAQAKTEEGIYRYTEREWRERNYLPSFGLVGNQGHAIVRWHWKLFGRTIWLKIQFYNAIEPLAL